MSATALREDSPHLPAGFGMAVVLHGLLFAWLAYYFWTHASPVQSSPHVFELVAPPSPTPGSRTVSPATTTTPAVQATQIGALPNVKPVTIAETPPSPPRASQAKPPPALAPAVRGNTAPAAATKTPPATAQTTYDQFKKDVGVPKTPSPSTRVPTRDVPKVGVDDRAIVQSLENSAGRAGDGGQRGSAGTVSASELSDYIARLRARIEGAFENPAGLSLSGLKAQVELAVNARGQVTSWRLTRGSGNAVFDEAVKAALKRLTNVDPPPGGQAKTFSVEFQWER